MAVHIAANTGCNLGCEYCYEEPDREMKEEQIDNEYDIDLILERLEQFHEKYPNIMPGMHGGEPLLLPIEDLRTIYQWIADHYEEFERDGSHIQTNGTLLREEHIELFDEFNVSVGISMDGPKELNDSRIARSGGEDVTRKMTERTYETIEEIIEHDSVSCGIIVVLTKTNVGTDEKLEKLLDWLDYLNRNDISGHYNPALPYEDIQEDLSLSPERLKEVYIRTWEWMNEESYREWDPMRDYQQNLLGMQLGNCVNTKCDVYNANSAKIIKGDGGTSGCGKTWGEVGDGVPFLQGDSTNNEYGETEERYEMLRQLPGPYTEEVQNGEIEDQGGCKGCRYWPVCQGGCPAGGLKYDYRNRVYECEAVYGLYERIEKDMKSMFPAIRTIPDAVDEGINDVLEIASASRRVRDIGAFDAMRAGTSAGDRVTIREHAKALDAGVSQRILQGVKFDSEEEKYDAYSTIYPEEGVEMRDGKTVINRRLAMECRNRNPEDLSEEEISEMVKSDEYMENLPPHYKRDDDRRGRQSNEEHRHGKRFDSDKSNKGENGWKKSDGEEQKKEWKSVKESKLGSNGHDESEQEDSKNKEKSVNHEEENDSHDEKRNGWTTTKEL